MEQYQTAERSLARGMQKLRNRIDRRREWMFAKAVVNGGFSYLAKGGTKVAVSYGIPATHIVTLGSTRVWDVGTAKNPIEDVLTGRQVLQDDAGVVPSYALLNSNLLTLLMIDADIQTLLKKSAFGNGDLFSRPAEVMGALLGVPLRVYDGFSETQQTLSGAVTGGATTVIPVPDASDIEVGATARFYDVSKANTWEDATVSAVDILASTFTISAVTTASFKANEDVVRFRTKTISDNDFLMFSDRNADGELIMEGMLSPFGVNRQYGVYVDTEEEWDPSALVARLQYKGLPVMYHPDCIYKMTVR